MNTKPVIVTFKLFPGKDDDLIDFLKSLGTREKSSYIRLAIRQQFINGGTPNFFTTGLPMQFAPAISIEHSGGNDNAKPAVLSDNDLDARLDRW
jgi:hypothetical protein